jgi:hypothetical protein
VSRAAEDPRPSRGSRVFGAVTYAVAPLARFRAGRAVQNGFTAAYQRRAERQLPVVVLRRCGQEGQPAGGAGAGSPVRAAISAAGSG